MSPESANTTTAARRDFLTEELAAQRMAFRGRTVSLLVIVVLSSILTPWPGGVFIWPHLALFWFLGWAGCRLAHSEARREWHQYAFVTADMALLTFTLLYPNPLVPEPYPPQLVFRFGGFVYFFVILAGFTYFYRPGLVIWAGMSAALCWIIGTGVFLLLPETTSELLGSTDMDSAISLLLDPRFVDVGVRVQEVIIILLTSGLLALAVARARRVALQRGEVAQQRANLARYFPKSTVKLLEQGDQQLTQPREQDAAVLFADLIAFTGWAERHSARETIALLRSAHDLLARIVFEQGGTLDKFIGDGMMATFGTPEPADDDATRALAAVVAMADRYAEWASIQSRDRPLPKLAVGAHFGAVVQGDIGSSERLEFAVLGDAVNIAARLEKSVRQNDCAAVISADLVHAADEASRAQLSHRLSGPVPLAMRGREQAINAYLLLHAAEADQGED